MRPKREQILVLVEEMERNPQLARGRLTGPWANKRSNELWRGIAARINACGSGPVKDGSKWRKYWVDKRNNIKSLVATYRSHNQTGGGPPNLRPLTDIEERISSIMGSGFGGGVPGAVRPLFPPAEIEIAEVNLPEDIEVPDSKAMMPPPFASPPPTSPLLAPAGVPDVLPSTPAQIETPYSQNMESEPPLQRRRRRAPVSSSSTGLFRRDVREIEARREERDNRLIKAVQELKEAVIERDNRLVKAVQESVSVGREIVAAIDRLTASKVHH